MMIIGSLVSLLVPILIIGAIIYYFANQKKSNNNKNMEQSSKEMLVKFKKVGLAISIIIVLNILIWTAIETFYKTPQYEDYCPQKQVEKQSTDQTSCVNAGGQWFENERIDPQTMAPVSQDAAQGYCYEQYECEKLYNDKMNVYNRNVFIIRAIFGFIALAVGLAITSVAAVANGLLYGGILSIIIGTTGYWGAMDEYLRFAIMLPTFILLIYLGYRKLRD